MQIFKNFFPIPSIASAWVFSIAISMLSAFSCSKKDCGEPCKFVMQCAEEHADISSFDTVMLNSACDKICTKYNAAFMNCYSESVKKDNPCQAYFSCTASAYEKGNY